MRWIYKTIHFELKKDGLLGGIFLDESEMEETLNEFGRAGWELISLMDTRDGIIGVFKQPIPGSPVSEEPAEEVEYDHERQQPMSFVEQQIEPDSELIEPDDGQDHEYISEAEEIPEPEMEEPAEQDEEPCEVPDVGRIKIE